MRRSRYMVIFSATATYGGFALVVYSAGWLTAIGAFLIAWGFAAYAEAGR